MLREILFLLFFVQSDCRESYLTTVLSSKNTNHYFLVIKASVNKIDKELIVLNCNLFKYFKYKDKKFSNIISYGNEIKRKLDNQEAIVISKSATKKVDGFFVREDSSVMAIASKGRDYFINYYFNVSEENTYARLKHDVEEDEVPQIIKTLFEWNYFTGIVEGSITIFNIKFCEK